MSRFAGRKPWSHAYAYAVPIVCIVSLHPLFVELFDRASLTQEEMSSGRV
jgi:hypothetical protein